MNRRDFLKLIVLVPAALAVKVQGEPKVISEAHKFKTIDKIAFGHPSDYSQKIGQEVFEGYVEGIQKPISSMVITVYDHIEFEKIRPEDTYSVCWTSEEADPLADLKAMQDFMLEERGISPLLMQKRFEPLFSEKDKSGIRFI